MKEILRKLTLSYIRIFGKLINIRQVFVFHVSPLTFASPLSGGFRFSVSLFTFSVSPNTALHLSRFTKYRFLSIVPLSKKYSDFFIQNGKICNHKSITIYRHENTGKKYLTLGTLHRILPVFNPF